MPFNLNDKMIASPFYVVGIICTIRKRSYASRVTNHEVIRKVILRRISPCSDNKLDASTIGESSR